MLFHTFGNIQYIAEVCVFSLNFFTLMLQPKTFLHSKVT